MLLDADMSKITRITNCQKPCTYKEYKFVNTVLKDLSYYDFPEDRVAFCLWALSQNILLEEEVLVYSLHTLVVPNGLFQDHLGWIQESADVGDETQKR